MKVKARNINAGDRVILNDAGKRSSWHVNEFHLSGKGPDAIVIVHLDRVVRGEREKRSREFGANHRVEVTQG